MCRRSRDVAGSERSRPPARRCSSAASSRSRSRPSWSTRSAAPPPRPRTTTGATSSTSASTPTPPATPLPPRLQRREVGSAEPPLVEHTPGGTAPVGENNYWGYLKYFREHPHLARDLSKRAPAFVKWLRKNK